MAFGLLPVQHIGQMNSRQRSEGAHIAAARGVMESYGLDDGRRESPQAEEIRTDSGMCGSEHFGFGRVKRELMSHCVSCRLLITVRQTSGEHQFAEIMQHPGDVCVFGAGGFRPVTFHDASCQPCATQSVFFEVVNG